MDRFACRARGSRVVRVLVTLALWTAGASTALAVSLVTSATAQAAAFSYTGGEQTYTVPAGVNEVSINAIGAAGGTAAIPPQTYPGGRGAMVSGVVDVTPGETLYVEVGGVGSNPAGGFNGGGNGAAGAGASWVGGGGASDVRTLPISDGMISLNSRLIVAGGGGGAPGGGDAGQPGGSGSAGGGAGTQTSGGAGGCPASNLGCGGAGTLGQGGEGGYSGTGADQRFGGGGGGGLYGGGGGGADLTVVGGGGGGSSLLPAGGTMTIAPLTTPASVNIIPVPAPSCQDGTMSTPFGQPLVVQLMCTEYAGKPLTYTIVGAPAHGTLSVVSPSGQVMYTPAVGFSGVDSFTYDASSTNGNSGVQTISITVGPNPVGVASAGRARGNRTMVEVSVACAGAVGAHCQLTVAMSVTETSAGGKLVAVSSARSKRHKTRKVVTVGGASIVVMAGTSQIVGISLNSVGRHLLSTFGKLPVSIAVTQTAGSRNILISHQTVTLKAGPRKHNKTH